MTDQSDRFSAWAGQAGWLGTIVLLVGCVTAILAPQAAIPAARFAAVACFQPVFGCLIFALIYRTTGGQWGKSLERPLAAGVRLVPWVWPFFAGVTLLRWSRPDLPLPAGSAPMPGTLALAERAVAYELILLGLRAVALRPSLWRYAPPALIALVFGGHFLAADCFFVLEPGWYSTGFPLVWMAICAAAGLSLAVIVAAAGGRNPAVPGEAGRPVGLDWGNLLLTAVVFSTYLAFMEYLIIWSGNLPAEISWYVRRERGVWPFVALFLALVHLAFPFLLLLSRRWKESPRGVPIAAFIVAVAEIGWALWLVLPPFGDRGPWLIPFSAAFFVGGAGLLLNRYLSGLAQGEIR